MRVHVSVQTVNGDSARDVGYIYAHVWIRSRRFSLTLSRYTYPHAHTLFDVLQFEFVRGVMQRSRFSRKFNLLRNIHFARGRAYIYGRVCMYNVMGVLDGLACARPRASAIVMMARFIASNGFDCLIFIWTLWVRWFVFFSFLFL